MIDENKIKSLLNFHKESIKIETMKWYKDLNNSTIYIEKRPYQLDIANFKRNLIYNYYSPDKILLEQTSSIILENNKISSFGNYIMKEGVIYKEII